MAVFTHPAHLAGGDAQDQRIGSHVLSDHRAGAHEGITPDAMATDDRGVGADRGALFDQGRLVRVLAGDGAAGIDHIGENGTGADEHIVFTHDTFVQADVVLHLDPAAEPDAIRYEYVLAQAAAGADHRFRHDVTEVPDPGTRPDPGALVDDGARMGVVFGTAAHAIGKTRG